MGETNQPKKLDTIRGDEPGKTPVSAYDEAGRDPNVEQPDKSNAGKASDDENQHDESANPGQRADDADEGGAERRNADDVGPERGEPAGPETPIDLSKPAKDPYGV